MCKTVNPKAAWGLYSYNHLISAEELMAKLSPTEISFQSTLL